MNIELNGCETNDMKRGKSKELCRDVVQQSSSHLNTQTTQTTQQQKQLTSAVGLDVGDT